MSDDDFDIEKFLREESSAFNQEKEVKRIIELEETSKNPFEILNVDPKIWTNPPGSALHIHEWFDPALIKKLFREKSLLVHPDKCSLEKAPEAFQLLKKAHTQLTNPEIVKELYHYTRDAIYLVKSKDKSPIADIILTVRRLIKDVNDRIQLRIKNTEERDVEQVVKQVDDLIKVAKQEKEWAATREKRVGSWRDWQTKGPKKKKLRFPEDVLFQRMVYLFLCMIVAMIYGNLDQFDWISKSVSSEEMVKMYHDYKPNDDFPKSRNFNTSYVLAYVTPWNGKGYDIAKEFRGRGKFTHISPVWLNLEPDDASIFKITGTHDIDVGWMDQVRQDNDALIVPRLIFSKMATNHYISLIQNETLSLAVVELIIKNLKHYKFDGVVLEVGVPIRYLQNFIKFLSKELKSLSKRMQIFLVIPPYHTYHQEELVSENDLKLIIDFIDGLSLMTYDYTASSLGGPNAPIQWISDNVARLDPHELYRSKILMGMNLYGYDYSKSNGRQDIVGSTFVDIIKENSVTITWSESDGEHFFEYQTQGDSHNLYYPTLPSLNERINLAQKMGTGLSLWEIGQGQNMFYELL